MGDFVQLPASQRLANSESVICIAVNDVTSNQYDLVLYELKNTSSIRFVSDRFVGLLSKDYVQKLTLQLNIKADRALIDPVSNFLDIKFEIDVDPRLMSIHTILPTTCEIFVSPVCKYSVSTSDKALSFTQSISKNCGYLYERASYTCQEGIYGSFFPPIGLVKTRLSDFAISTSAFVTQSQDFSSEKQFVDSFKRFLTYCTWQNMFIFMALCVFLC